MKSYVNKRQQETRQDPPKKLCKRHTHSWQLSTSSKTKAKIYPCQGYWIQFLHGFRETPCRPQQGHPPAPHRPNGSRKKYIICFTGQYGDRSKPKSCPQWTSDSIPTKVGSKMGGEFTYPKMVPLVLNHCHMSKIRDK